MSCIRYVDDDQVVDDPDRVVVRDEWIVDDRSMQLLMFIDMLYSLTMILMMYSIDR